MELLEFRTFTLDSVDDRVGSRDLMASAKFVMVWDIELDSARRD